MPDLPKVPNPHRPKTNPRVEFQEWCMAMAQRAEGGVKRDLTALFAMWQLQFKQKVNEGKSLFHTTREAERQLDDGTHVYRPEDIKSAAQEIYTALESGRYLGESGYVAVDGDMGKVHRVAGLSTLAHRMVTSYTATSHQIPGTQEVRSSMRGIAEGMRVTMGRHLFVTISPNVAQSALVLRFFRMLADDPYAECNPELAIWGSRNTPSLEQTHQEHNLEESSGLFIPIEKILDKVPIVELCLCSVACARYFPPLRCKFVSL